MKHLIGIGGVGMSALAVAYRKLGHEVSGADRNLNTPNIRFLESLGIACYPDDGSGITKDVDEVVVSTAIEQTNPGIAKAQDMGIEITHRARALSTLLAPFKLIAVVGTCGKSTVAAMLGHVLAECGLDPFCVNGANVVGWEGAVRAGNGMYAVAEVDESDKSLVAFNPYAAIVTNASADHYSKEEMDQVFDAFIKDVPGPVIDGRAGAPSHAAFTCSMPGAHNQQNATLAAKMAIALGCDEDKVRAALMTFKGVERRLQKHGAAVYDDYAHNPEKLFAMWTTVKAEHPRGICVIWRPHGYAPLRKMKQALADMFNNVLTPWDKLLVLPVYDAGGTTTRDINNIDLVNMIPHAECVGSHDDALNWIKTHPAYDAYVTCGARDPDLPQLADAIASLSTSTPLHG